MCAGHGGPRGSSYLPMIVLRGIFSPPQLFGFSYLVDYSPWGLYILPGSVGVSGVAVISGGRGGAFSPYCGSVTSPFCLPPHHSQPPELRAQPLWKELRGGKVGNPKGPGLTAVPLTAGGSQRDVSAHHHGLRLLLQRERLQDRFHVVPGEVWGLCVCAHTHTCTHARIRPVTHRPWSRCSSQLAGGLDSTGQG